MVMDGLLKDFGFICLCVLVFDMHVIFLECSMCASLFSTVSIWGILCCASGLHIVLLSCGCLYEFVLHKPSLFLYVDSIVVIFVFLFNKILNNNNNKINVGNLRNT